MLKRYVAGPHVITADGVMHFNAAVGRRIKVNGRLFDVSWNSQTNCFESTYFVRNTWFTSAGRTRAYLAAYIHIAMCGN